MLSPSSHNDSVTDCFWKGKGNPQELVKDLLYVESGTVTATANLGNAANVST